MAYCSCSPLNMFTNIPPMTFSTYRMGGGGGGVKGVKGQNETLFKQEQYTPQQGRTKEVKKKQNHNINIQVVKSYILDSIEEL